MTSGASGSSAGAKGKGKAILQAVDEEEDSEDEEESEGEDDEDDEDDEEDDLCLPGLVFTRFRVLLLQADPGCGFFVWYDVGIAAAAEKQHLVRLVDFLENRVVELEHENNDLRKRVCELTDVGISDSKVVTELDMLAKRVSHLEMSTGLGSLNN
ncbi:hypothetical protein LINPERHAP2_LOCUS19968, partial [Linum perenne]